MPYSASLELFPSDCADPRYSAEYLASNGAHEDLSKMAADLISMLGDHREFSKQIGLLLRRAYDEVIDMPRTTRWSIAQLEKTEKTYVGTKVEILIRDLLDLPRGSKLDLGVGGVEVDVKNTTGDNWEIPSEAVGEICLLVQGNEVKEIFSIGLFRAMPKYLRGRTNKDGKRSIQSPEGKSHIFWIARNHVLPTNFILKMPAADRTKILDKKSGAARVVELFRVALNTPVRRDVVKGLARQEDPLKRIRRNGGARDILLNEGIVVLSGKNDSAWIQKLGYVVAADSFVSLDFDSLTTKKGDCLVAELKAYYMNGK